MKKIYVNPEINVVSIQTQQMIAESAPFGEGQKDGGVAAGRRNNRRRSNQWDEWDDEEEWDEEDNF